MGTIKPSAISRFLRSPDKAIRTFLVFGSEPGAVHECAAGLVKGLIGTDADSMNIVHLKDETLKEDPGRLADEAQAISMFGGQRVIWLRDPGPASTKTVTDLLENPSGDACLVVEAGNLAKSAALRKLFEQTKTAAAVPCYADSTQDLNDLVSFCLSGYGLKIEPDARAALIDLLGNNRVVSRSEINKLAIYCFGRESVTVEDVAAICGDASALSADSMIDAAFEGDAATACRNFSVLQEVTSGASGLLTSLARHVALLESLRIKVEAGAPIEGVIKSARPPVFFKRQGSIARQLRLWSLETLGRARKSVFDTTLRCRQQPDLEAEVAERCLISLARNAQAMRRR